MADGFYFVRSVEGGRFKMLAKDLGNGLHAPAMSIQQADGNPIAVHDSGAPTFTTLYGLAGASFTSADASATPAPVITAPGAAKKAKILGVSINTGAAPLTVTLTEETAGTVLNVFYMDALSHVDWKLPAALALSAVNKRLMVQTSGAGAVTVGAQYYAE